MHCNYGAWCLDEREPYQKSVIVFLSWYSLEIIGGDSSAVICTLVVADDGGKTFTDDEQCLCDKYALEN